MGIEPVGEGSQEGLIFADNGVETVLGPVNEVHLVHGDGQLADTQQGGDIGMAPRLVGYPLLGTYQDHSLVSRGGSCGHVSCVLLMAWSIGDDELAFRRGEIPVGDIDRDALFPLGT